VAFILGMQPCRERHACIDLPAFPVTIRKKDGEDA
jgi:hypothetical protein